MSKIFFWWSNIDSRIRIVSFLILVTSVVISHSLFNLFNSIYSHLDYASSCLSKDFTLALTHHIAFLIQNSEIAELKSFVEKIYLSTSSIHCVRLFNIHGDILISFPAQSILCKKEFASTIESSILNIGISQDVFFNTLTSIFIDNGSGIINQFLPLVYDKDFQGFLQLSLVISPVKSYSVKIAQYFSAIVFTIVWLMFAIGAAFNFFISKEPLRKLSIALRRVALGNFGHIINNSAKGNVGNLIIAFNQMSKHLLHYEQRNIAQLVSEKSKLERLVSIVTNGVILLDAELRLLLANQSAMKIFCWSSANLVGQTIFRHLPAHVNDAIMPILNSMTHSGSLDCEILHAKEISIDLECESLKTFRFLLSTVSNQKNEGCNCVIVVIQDVTREAQLDDAKSQFIGNVSHELRTPLCNIKSFLETLIDYEYRLTVQQKYQFLSIAYSETQRLNTLVNDILDLSRLDSECCYIFSPVALTHTVFYIVKVSQIIALNKRIVVIIEAHKQIGKVLAHESSLCQVLSNLVSNALKFTHEGGKIVVRLYPLVATDRPDCCCSYQTNSIRIEVIDEGIGINKSSQMQIFERFVRIENSIHMLKGTGLGLSIVKSIIEKHRSAIKVHSEIGIGTSFWFDLPIII